MMFTVTEIAQLCSLLFGVCLLAFASREDENVRIKNIIRKMIMYTEGSWFMIASKDNKKLGPKHNPCSDLLLKTGVKKSIKKVVFLRHGESDWNDIFNKGFGPSILVRLAKGFFREAMMMITMDSVFLDSPLNKEGFEQGKELNEFFNKDPLPTTSEAGKEIFHAIAGNSSTISSVIVASNLRRAIATTTVGLWSRLMRTKEQIMILSCLQEISRNVDTKALAPRGGLPDLHRITEYIDGDSSAFVPDALYDVSCNTGNKTAFFNGVKRLNAFNEWAFKRDEDMIIVGGHSLWFKNYFQMFVPHSSEHECKSKKIVNSGVVSFDLERWEDAEGKVIGFRVDPHRIHTVYGGFTVR
mmetsp:Transcript_7356/g.12370  ORF Transcript_7356/g.12370 Transcript_7356/m.12370 type:complete len:355 (-) Transcript_7356:3552-4616(-)